MSNLDRPHPSGVVHAQLATFIASAFRAYRPEHLARLGAASAPLPLSPLPPFSRHRAT
jgi:hypothetical protein